MTISSRHRRTSRSISEAGSCDAASPRIEHHKRPQLNRVVHFATQVLVHHAANNRWDKQVCGLVAKGIDALSEKGGARSAQPMNHGLWFCTLGSVEQLVR